MSKFASLAAGSALCLAVAVACSDKQPAAGKTGGILRGPQPDQAQNVSADASTIPASASGCDASLWNHVYNPSRLQVLDSCMIVTGVIEESDADPDGDQHFLLRLDPGQNRLLERKNAKKKGGDLVVEIVCANPVTIKKARGACPGYVNKIPIPAVGAHVSVTGSFVNDTHNSWTEIHPVALIKPIK